MKRTIPDVRSPSTSSTLLPAAASAAAVLMATVEEALMPGRMKEAQHLARFGNGVMSGRGANSIHNGTDILGIKRLENYFSHAGVHEPKQRSRGVVRRRMHCRITMADGDRVVRRVSEIHQSDPWSYRLRHWKS